MDDNIKKEISKSILTIQNSSRTDDTGNQYIPKDVIKSELIKMRKLGLKEGVAVGTLITLVITTALGMSLYNGKQTAEDDVKYVTYYNTETGVEQEIDSPTRLYEPEE